MSPKFRLAFRAMVLLGLVAGCLGLASEASARVYIDITKPISRRLPLALPAFMPMAGAAANPVGDEGHRRLVANLTYTGLFDLLDPKGFLGKPNPAAVKYRKWSRVGAELLITAVYRVEGDNLTLECRLFDVTEGKQLVGRRYQGRPADIKDMMLRFADAVMEALTGEPSVFGTQIAFVAARQGAKGVTKEIAVMNFDGSGVRIITRRNDLSLYPAWSPDGKLIAYTAYRNRRPVIYIQALAGGTGRVAVNHPGVNLTPAFKPGGGLAVAMSHTGKTNIFLTDLSGHISKQLTNGWGIEVNPTFSPDGNKMAFVSDRGGNPQIYVLDLTSGRVTRLTYGYKYAASPAWSPRGDRIAFQLEVNGVFQIATIRPDGGDLKILTRGLSPSEDPSWSPDGRLIAYAGRQSGRYQIYVITAAGELIKRLTSLPGDNTDPAWSPRGAALKR